LFEFILETPERKSKIMKIKNRTVTALASSALATVLVVGLGGFGLTTASASGKLKTGQTFYLIPKDTLNPYETLEDGGIAMALKSLGDKTVISSGTADTAAAQIPSIQAAIQHHAAGIVIAGNDPSALCPSLAQAHAAGLAIVSADSDVTCPNHLFINQANTQQIGIRSRPSCEGDRLQWSNRHPVGSGHRDEPELMDQVHEGGAQEVPEDEVGLDRIR
jgi:ABC-type sugar transport system substrate-binding protein